jgi:hypothetical protein
MKRLDPLPGQVSSRTVESAAIRVEANRDDPGTLALVLPEAEAPVAHTHWSFGQLVSLVAAPATHLRQLPAPLAGIDLQYGLTNHRAEQVKTIEVENGRTELRAVNDRQALPHAVAVDRPDRLRLVSAAGDFL